MINLIVILAIFASIAIGYRTKINTGIVAILFAYVIGCFVLGLKPKAVIAMWPVSTMFSIMSITLFYGMGVVNGTLEKTARYLLYYMRGYKKLLPMILFLIAVLIGALGAGNFAVVAFMAPLSIMLCDEAGISLLVAAVAINGGSLVGGNFMTSNLGMIFRQLTEEATTAAALEGYDSFYGQMIHFAVSFFFFGLLVLGFTAVCGKKQQSIEASVTMQKPESFDPKQKTTLRLMVAMLVLVLSFPILHMICADNSVITYLNSKIDVNLVACVFALVALLMNLAPQKEVIAKVPWGTIIMVCGVGMLVQVAIEAGTVQMLASWIGTNIPVAAVPIVFALIAGIMSFFSSTIGVVCPTLFPLIPGIAATTGLSPLALFTCTLVGSQSTACSPLSASGSMIVGSCPTTKEQNELFQSLITRAVPISLAFALVTAAVLSIIL